MCSRGAQATEPENLGFGPTWASQQLPDLGKLLMLFQPQFFIFTKGIR